MSYPQVLRWSFLLCIGTACSGASDATDTNIVEDTSDDGGSGSGGDQDSGGSSAHEVRTSISLTWRSVKAYLKSLKCA